MVITDLRAQPSAPLATPRAQASRAERPPLDATAAEAQSRLAQAYPVFGVPALLGTGQAAAPIKDTSTRIAAVMPSRRLDVLA